MGLAVCDSMAFMRYPNFDGKHANDSMIEPHNYVEYKKTHGDFPTFAPPNGVILCYKRSLLTHIKKNHQVTSCDGFLSKLLFLNETDKTIAVMGGFGIGAPVASIIMEELIAFGVKEFISIGTAGTLQKDIHIGDLIVCDKAIRDEGTSHHYLRPGKFTHPSRRLTRRLTEALTGLGKDFRLGTTWTIDAPYRETIAEARHYRQEGVATVDMEAAALFAVAKFRSVDIASAFTVTDSLADLKWHPEFHSPKAKDGLEIIYRAAVAAL